MGFCAGYLFYDVVLSVISSFATILPRKRGLVVLFLLQFDCLCSVSLSRSAVGRSVVCDCGKSWSYALVFQRKC